MTTEIKTKCLSFKRLIDNILSDLCDVHELAVVLVVDNDSKVSAKEQQPVSCWNAGCFLFYFIK